MNRFSQLIACLVSASLMIIAGCSGVTDSRGPSTNESSAIEAKHPFDPTVARTPKFSKSLTLSPSWTPPSPTRTSPTQMKQRVQPSKHYGVPTAIIGEHPSDDDIRKLTIFPEPLRPVPGTSSQDETNALAVALREEAHDDRGMDAVMRFVDAHPQSRWAPALHLNLGALSYGTGYFQDALDHWRAAWELAKSGDDIISQQIANQALAEYARMNARVGRTDELEALLAQAQTRTFMGDARVKIEGAAEGLWMMRHRPEISFLCGPYALSNVAQSLDPSAAKKSFAWLDKVKSPMTGFSVTEVLRMSTELGLKLQIAKREPGAALIVPAVVHWKVGHFGALVREAEGTYRLQDPTFRNDTWMTKQAIDHEASGYFLVPAGPLPEGWSHANEKDASRVYGKGFTDEFPPSPGPGPEPCPNCCNPGPGPGPGPGPDGPGPDSAMAKYRFLAMEASVYIEDTPVGYAAAVGPDVRVHLAYSQREDGQPATMDFTNFGPQFVSNWISYLIDNPSNASADITVRLRDGGTQVHQGYNSTTQSFAAERMTAAVLTRLTANTYKKIYPDGREEYYEHYIGTTGTQRKVFLSRIIDPAGREVAIDYDSTYPTRIHQIVDATGLPTTFNYALSGSPYLVTSIEDPFGREGTFAYTTVASKLRLQSTEDPYGIVSAFTYSAAGEIVEMSTPYGTTTFTLSSPFVNAGESLIRYVEATDALGQKERLEFNISTALTGVAPSLETPYPSSSVVSYMTSYNNYRNSFYWDKLAMKLAPGNYQKAHRYHWLHSTITGVAPILESEMRPLEGRIFYNYPNQPQANLQGSSARPTVIARVVKDAAGADQTQATKKEYNAQGNVTKVTDPLGRQTLYEYDTNGVDVLNVKQRTGTSGGNPVWTTVTTYTYGSGAPPHRPATVTDGAGQTTSYTYTSSGQVATVTNAKSEVTTFTYETSTSSPSYDKLLTITGDVAGGNRTFTYDTYGRMATTTDSESYTLTYDYDALDRVRTITYPDGSTQQYEYEDHSLVASKDRAGRWTRHMYNPNMQRVVTQDPELRMTQQQWCRCGQMKRFVDGNGNITEWQRDEAARVTKKIMPNAAFDLYTYDFSGRLSTEVDAMNRTTTYTYNVDDRLAKKDYSDTSTPDVTYSYDTWYPRVTSRVDGAGTTTFTYHPHGASTNGAGQVALINGPLTDDTQKHTYDQLGRLKKLEIVDDSTQTTASYSQEFTFDARSRVTTVANNLGSTSYAFVGQSNRPSQVDFPNGMQTLYDYFGATGDHLLKQIKNLTAGPTPTVISQFDYTYAADRAISTWTVDQGSGATTWSFGYDGARQLTSADRNAVDGGALVESNTYGYDKAGNRIQVAALDAGAPKNYDVNNLNQLLSERDHGKTTFAGYTDEPATVTINGQKAKVLSTDGGAPYKFEGVVTLDAGTNNVVVEAKDGQNNTRTNTYAVTTSGEAKKFEYDANGNLRYEKQPNNTIIREYRWDQQNRLVRYLQGTHESVYEYDGESHRVRIKELESSVETKNETFVWCGSKICQKRSGSTVVRSYFGGGFEEGSSDYFYTRDHLGSVREIVASNGTTVSGRVSYGPWGSVTESGSVLTDFSYTGHFLDRPAGLALARARGYDAHIGRWLSADPIGLAGGPNLYGYVENNPINYVDLLGNNLSSFVRCIFGGGGLKQCWEEELDLQGCAKHPELCSDLGGNPPQRPFRTPQQPTKDCDKVWHDTYDAALKAGKGPVKAAQEADAAEEKCRRENEGLQMCPLPMPVPAPIPVVP